MFGFLGWERKRVESRPFRVTVSRFPSLWHVWQEVQLPLLPRPAGNSLVRPGPCLSQHAPVRTRTRNKGRECVRPGSSEGHTVLCVVTRSRRRHTLVQPCLASAGEGRQLRLHRAMDHGPRTVPRGPTRMGEYLFSEFIALSLL